MPRQVICTFEDTQPGSVVTPSTITGVTLRDTRLTYLDPHGMPSGGDWALQRSGAVFLQGTEQCKVDNAALLLCYMERGSWVFDNCAKERNAFDACVARVSGKDKSKSLMQDAVENLTKPGPPAAGA